RTALEQQRVNVPVLTALAGGGEISETFVEELLAALPSPPFEKDSVHQLMGLLSDFAQGIDFWGLSEYPKLANERTVRDAINAERQGDAPPLACLSSAAMALIPNSPDTRGVLFELEAIANAPRLSTPLRVLFGERRAESAKWSTARSEPCVPAVLSQAQVEVMESACSNPLTLVIGPPGTGKSYTIAALALDQLSKGRSVVVASRMHHAIEVIHGKIEDMLGPTQCVVRAGREESVREMKKYLELLLQGIRPRKSDTPIASDSIRRSLAQTERLAGKLERRLEQLSALEQRWGLVTTQSAADGLWSRLQLAYLNWRKATPEPLWALTGNYEQLLEQRTALTRQLLQELIAERLDTMVTKHRGDLTKLLHALRSRTDRKKERMFGEIDLDVLFRTFPIWLVTMSELSEVLPLGDELFDVAIIDEATQCDMASCLPLLQRARRIAIVGDPNQLRHVSFLSRERQRLAAEEFGLDDAQQGAFAYRDKSVLDLVNESIGSQKSVMFLDEHFRSLPQIIAFSNREFYADALRIMTRRPETTALRAIELRRVQGSRNEQGVNRAEADALVEEVTRRIGREAGLSGTASSIGILSPFRDQVDHLLARIEKAVSLDALRKHDILVGTAHTFQGEERDVMYLSLVVDPESHAATFRFLNNPNVFNVAVTRARNYQYVFCSVDAESLEGDSLLRRYLQHAEAAPASTVEAGTAVDDAFLVDVRGALESAGIQVLPSYVVAGMKIDLVATRDG
ncbi:MAG: ATP-binding protein, partial [Bryobacteraceae bacterium]|nr:ATP-binding protein [Bryobacteraceae bacterium]